MRVDQLRRVRGGLWSRCCRGVYRITGAPASTRQTRRWRRRSGPATARWSHTAPPARLLGHRGRRERKTSSSGCRRRRNPRARTGRRCTEGTRLDRADRTIARSDPDHHADSHADRPLGAHGGRSAARGDGERVPARSSARRSGLLARVGRPRGPRVVPAPAGSRSCSPQRARTAARVGARGKVWLLLQHDRPAAARSASTGSHSPAAAIASTSPGPSASVGLECDGWEHHGHALAFGQDRERLAEIVARTVAGAPRHLGRRHPRAASASSAGYEMALAAVIHCRTAVATVRS